MTGPRVLVLVPLLLLAGCGAGDGGTPHPAADTGGGEPDAGGEGEGEGATPLCVPGRAESCPCEDGRSGAQTCNEDGMGYGPCRCAPAEGEGEGPAEGEGEGPAEGEGEGPAEGEGEGPAEGEGEGPDEDPVGTPCGDEPDPCPDARAPECVDTGGLPYCTRECDPQADDCPDDYCCGEVGEDDLCVPEQLCREPGECDDAEDCPVRWPECVAGRCHGAAGPGDPCEGGFSDCDPRASTDCVVDPLLGQALCTTACEPELTDCGAGRCCFDTGGSEDPEDYYCLPGQDRCQAPGCDNDEHEPNEGAGGAVELAAAGHNLDLCPDDEDWFSVTLREGETLRAALSYAVEAGQGRVLLELRDAGEALLASAVGPEGAEELALLSPDPGRYLLRVRSSNREDERAYRLELTVGCQGVDDCPGRQTCGGGGLCEDGPPPCLADQDCVGGRVCNQGTHQCERVCNDDAREDNDDAGAPTHVQPGTHEDLTVCPDDEDWFAVAVGVGNGLEARIDFVNAAGDLDLEVYTPDGADDLAESSGTGDSEVVRVEVADLPGEYLVRVFGFGGESGPYTLTLAVEQGGFCREDGLEDNDDADGAWELVEPGTVEDLRACEGDHDWYTVPVRALDTLVAHLDFQHADGNLDLEVIGPDGQRLLGASRSATDDEHVEAEAEETGDHYVHVIPQAGADAGYTLTTEIQRFRPPCNDDGEEDNDDFGTATPVETGQPVVGLWSCPEDDDVFSIHVERGAALTGRLTFDGDDGNLDLTLYGPDHLFLDEGAAEEGDMEEVGLGFAPGSGDYFLKVGSPDLVAAQYTLLVEVDLAGVCQDDLLEDNDLPGQADPLQAGRHDALARCDGDDDWYRFDKAPADDLYVELFFSHADGDLDLTLYDAGGNESLLVSESATDNEQVNTLGLVAHAGEAAYLARVHGGVGEQAGYVLVATVIPAHPGCDDDVLEPNDCVLNGMPIGEGVQPDLDICPADPDHFRIALEAGLSLTATIALDHAAGDLDLFLYGPSGLELLDSDTGAGDQHTVTVGPVPAAATYFVRVAGAAAGVENGYSLTVEVE